MAAPLVRAASNTDPAVLEKNRKRRGLILNELLTTEENYVKALDVLVRVFYNPLVAKLDADAPILSQEEIVSVFANVDELLAINTAFLEQMRAQIAAAADSKKEASLGSIFLFVIEKDLFKSPYCKYINNYTKSTDAISALHEDNTAFVRFLKQCRRNPACRFDSISSFLVTPIQRIPRYILFLQDYAKCAPEDPVLKGELALALLEMQKLASVLNESKRASENIQAMLALFENQIDINTVRYLLADGPMTFLGDVLKKRPKPVRIMLFDDVLLCASQDSSATKTDAPAADKAAYRMEWSIDISSLRLEEKSDDAAGGKAYLVLTEQRKIPTYPFTMDVPFALVPNEHPPHDMAYWRKSFRAAIEGFWLRNKSRILDASSDIERHMTNNLLSNQDWAFLTVGASRIDTGPNVGHVIIKEGLVNKSFYWIETGSIRVEKRLGEKTLTLSTMTSGEFFGEMSLLSLELEISASASIVTEEPYTIVHGISFDKLTTLFLAQPDLGMRFYTLICYKLANRFVHQPFRRAINQQQEEERQRAAERERLMKQAAARAAAANQGRGMTAAPGSPKAAVPRLGLPPQLASSEADGSPKSVHRSLLLSARRQVCSTNSLPPVTPRQLSKRTQHMSGEMSQAASVALAGTSSISSVPANQDKVLIKLGIPNETIMVEYACKLKDKKVGGRYILTQEYAAFYGKFFGKRIPIAIHQMLIKSVECTGTQLTITYGKGSKRDEATFSFKNEHLCAQAAALTKNLQPKSGSRSVKRSSSVLDFLELRNAGIIDASATPPPGYSSGGGSPGLPGRSASASSTAAVSTAGDLAEAGTSSPGERTRRPLLHSMSSASLAAGGSGSSSSSGSPIGSPLAARSASGSAASASEMQQMRRRKRGNCVSLIEDDWDILEAVAATRTYTRDEVILQAGAREQTLYQIVRGSCRVQAPKSLAAELDDETEVFAEQLGKISKGEVFGHVAFVLGTVATANVIADEDDTEIVSFERARLETCFADAPDTGTGFYEWVARQLRDLFVKTEKLCKQAA